MSGLARAAAFFTEESRSLACMSVACGTADTVRTAESRVGPDAVFDIASLTKLFTAMAVLRLREEGVLDLSAPVTRYAPQYARLAEVAVDRVFGFEVSLQTDGRIDAAPDRAEALRRLHDLTPRPNAGTRFYSDIHCMVLRDVIEGAAGAAWTDVVRRVMLSPLGMRETWTRVPEAERGRCVSCDGEHRIEGGRMTVRRVAPGTPHDPKAAVLQGDTGECFGHAGLFAARGDLVRLCQGILRGDVVSRESLALMARCRTGRALPDGGYTQYLGSQCYVKHPVQYFSEVPEYFTEHAVAWSGFTGCHLSIDPSVGAFEFYLGSRVRDRLSFLVPPEGKTLADYGLAPDGTGCVRWEDGTEVVSSVDYVHLKDAHYHPAVREALGL